MKITTKQLAGAVIDLIEHDHLSADRVADACVTFLSERNEMKRMHDVFLAIERLWKERYGAATICVETAYPISQTLRAQIKQIAIGAEIRETVDLNLIGGARVTIDDRVIDGTMLTTLEQLRRTLYGN